MASEEEAASKLKEWRTAEHGKGTDTELLTIRGGSKTTKLFVLCGDQFEASRAFRAGDFSVRMIKLSGNPVSMVTCMVGDHQWMLAKDSMALRVGARSFVFALPGLLYGLALPVGHSDHQCKTLEEIFSSFSAYQDLVGKEGSESSDPIPETEMWIRAYSEILKLATRTSTKITPTNPPKPAASACGSDITARKIQRAVRMSAAVKLVSRALLSGNLSPTDHLHVSVAPGAAHAYPTMWAAADLLDAIEAGAPPPGDRRAPPQGTWSYNREGLVMLLDVVKAYGGTTGAGGPRKKPRLDAVKEEVKGVGGSSCSGGRVEEVEKRVGTCGNSSCGNS